MREIVDFKRYTPDNWPAGYMSPRDDKPPVNAWYGIPTYCNDLDYWIEKTGLDLGAIFPLYRGVSFGVAPNNFKSPALPFLWCLETSPESTKAHVFNENKWRFGLVLDFFNRYQKYTITPLYAIQRIRNNPVYVEFVGYGGQSTNVDVSKSIAAALQRFYDQNGRMPDVVFDDYNGDPRLPAPVFESDELGIKCPTWAALSFFSHPNIASVVFTDRGPRFLNEYEYRRFQAAFWQSVTGLMLPLKRSNSVFGSFYVSFERPASLSNFFNDGAGLVNPEYVPPIPLELAKKIAGFYVNEITAFSKAASDAAEKQAYTSFLSSVAMLFFTLPALLSSTGALLAGNVTFSNVLNAVKLADMVGLVDAQKLIALGGFGSTVYGLTQGQIDSYEAVNVSESATLDAAPVLTYTVPVDATPTPDRYTMDNVFGFYDFGGESIGTGYGFELDSSIWDQFDLDFSFVDSFGDFSDWGTFSTIGGGYGASFESIGDAWGITLDGFDTSSLYVAPDETVFNLAADAPGLSVQQVGFSVGNSIADSTAAEQIITTAENSGDFWGTFDSMLKSSTAAVGALAKLYVSYKTAEAQISAASGKPAQLPTTATRPTQPGQIVRQPDGSISVMDASGTIRTIKPDGSTVTTGANQSLPNFNPIFSKQNLMIGGAALAAGVLVFLATKGK